MTIIGKHIHAARGLLGTLQADLAEVSSVVEMTTRGSEVEGPPPQPASAGLPSASPMWYDLYEMIAPQAGTLSAFWPIRHIRRSVHCVQIAITVFMYFAANTAHAECNTEQARLIKRFEAEVLRFKKKRRKPYQDKDLKNYLLPTYKQLIRIVKSCQSGVEIERKRTLLLEAGEFSLQLYEWDAAYAFCEEYLGLAELQENRLRGEQCLYNAENRNAPVLLPSVNSTPGQESSKPAEAAKPQESHGAASTCVPTTAPPLEQKKCPECQSCPPQSTELPELPILTLKFVYRCERLKEVNQAVACYRRLLMEHTRAEAGSAERISERLRSDIDLTLNYSRSRNDAMWGAGLALWMAAYVPTLIFSGLYISKLSNVRPTTTDTLPPTVYGLLAIPLAGPFISGGLFAVSDFVTDGEKLRYSLPWILASGIPQVVGFALLVSGALRTDVRKTRPDMAKNGSIPFLLTPQITRTFTGLTVSSGF